jgi:hypothetical protein
LSDLDDAWRWRFMSRILGMREGFPQATYDRCAGHDNFRLVTGAPWTDVQVLDDAVVIETQRGRYAADFLICGTGIDVDFSQRPELQRVADNIARWSDRYDPPEAERDERLARYPYLGPDFSLLPRRQGTTDWMTASPEACSRATWSATGNRCRTTTFRKRFFSRAGDGYSAGCDTKAGGAKTVIAGSGPS